jgi:hypothetical protein
MATPTMEQPAREALARREADPYQPPDHAAAVAPKVDLSLDPSTYVGMSEAPVDEAQATILSRPLEPGDVDVRPDGQVYMSHAKLRQRLNEAFRPGGWAIRRLSSIDVAVATEAQADRATEFVMSAEFALYAGGRFLSAARGEQKYQDNGEMTYGDAAEGMKSNAISRCCKDLGIALDLWDRGYADAWRNQHCVKVWGEDRKGNRWRKPQWRKADGLPLYGETGPTDDSPNQDRYVYPNINRRRGEPSQETRQAAQAPPPRQREPGDDDEPVQRPAPRQEAPRPPQDAPRPSGGGRTISEAQQKRLYAIATREGGLDKDGYRDLLARWDYRSDRDVRVNDYDAIVEAARGNG